MRKFLLFLIFYFCITAKIMAQAPVISGISQLNAPAGTVITLNGSGFNTTAANNLVFFGAVATTASAASASSLTVTVPAGASYGPLNVLNTGTNRYGASTKYFNPTFSPNKGSITVQDIAPKVDFTAGTAPTKVVIGDIDGDGKPDLVTINGTSNTVSVLRNNSSDGSIVAGSFAAKVDIPTGNGPTSVAIGDLDGDGKPDLAITNYYDNTVSVLRNTGSTGTIAFVNSLNYTVGVGVNSVAIGDLANNDGKPDLAIIWRSTPSNNIMVLANRSSPGTISFGPGFIYSAGSDATHVSIADMDGDGKSDLVIANRGGNNISVLRRNGSGFANALSYAVGASPWSLTIGDLDGDGRLDVAVANEDSETVSVLRNTGSSGNIAFAPAADFNVASRPFAVAVGDMDGDGRPDLVTIARNENSLSLLRNISTTNTPAFAAAVKYTVAGPYSIAIADLNGDGKPDLATTNLNNNSISVLRNDPQYQQPQTIQPIADITKTYGDADFAPGATASSGLEVTYASADNTIAEVYQDASDHKWKLRIKKAGRVRIIASQSGNTFFYPAQDVTFDLIIDQKAITVTAAAKSKTYGDADPALTYTPTPVLLTGDTFSGSLIRAAGEQAGSYAIEQGTLTAGNNYAISYTGANLVIDKKAVTVTAQVKSKTYGDADPALTYTNTGLIGSDALTGSLARNPGEDAGTYIIGQGTLNAGTNYSLTMVTAAFSINKATLTVTAANAGMCQGGSLPAFTVSYSGFKRGDSESNLTTRPIVSTTATPSSAAGSYTLVPGGAAANNYTFVYVNGTLNISPLQVITINSDKGGSISKGETVVLSIPAGTASYSWTGPDILSGQGSRMISVRPQANAVYTVTVTNAQGCSLSASFTLNVREDFQVVTAKNILTPNGDGYNDTWVVDNIDYYPNNTVTIFDRNSRIVYTKQKYDNSWDGNFNGSLLPGGTYYYIIDYGTGKGKQKGFITLVR